ncbi:uncharacterized protein LOC133835971 isoform X2 [Drosophila sulfurigaster albostrigata]|uniref:uncharacterized protein LOC133835971 isoform X2 n=1 Tax=Drosophila sulfurigaster albostrigata TaxID=89887 RepID=UPI002D218E08|nr:uncharacterized protein LOC133835971 isoform X2 [Drosophila sulfurigaster albostrigata]
MQSVRSVSEESTAGSRYRPVPDQFPDLCAKHSEIILLFSNSNNWNQQQQHIDSSNSNRNDDDVSAKST